MVTDNYRGNFVTQHASTKPDIEIGHKVFPKFYGKLNKCLS